MTSETERELSDLFARQWTRLFREPRHRTFRECADGWIFGYTIDPTDPIMEGRYASLVWKPVGKGARSGKGRAERWDPVPTLFGIHRTKRQAKARAARLWRQHEARGLARKEGRKTR